MKLWLIILLLIWSGFSFGQRSKDTLILEFSPAMIDMSARLDYAMQAKIAYKFGQFYEISARHNHTLSGKDPIWAEKISPNPYGQSSFSEATFSMSLYGEGLISTARPEILERKYRPHSVRLDVGLMYSRYNTFRTEYYSYDTTSAGDRKVISSINVLSAAFGLSYVLPVLKGKSKMTAKLIRKHTLSAGFYHGLNYDLDGFVLIMARILLLIRLKYTVSEKTVTIFVTIFSNT